MMYEGRGRRLCVCEFTCFNGNGVWNGMEWIHVEAANNVGIVHIAV